MSSHEYGPSGYQQQQYGYAQTLQTVQSNTPHDMSKQVATAQPGMYQNSGGMPTQQHHQAIGGPVPNAQPATLVPQTQSIRPGHIHMQGYFPRSNLQRPIPSMTRTQIQTVMNPTGQQPTSQLGHVQVFPTATFPHGMQQVIVNPSNYQQVLNYQRTFNPPPQNLLYPTQSQQVYLNQHWGYNNPPAASSNGYYSTPAMPAYNTMQPAQQISQQPPAQQQKKTRKALPIIDPKSGKNILDNINDDDNSRPIQDKDIENAEQNINLQVQFATQVAATLTDKGEPLSKSSSVEDTRILDSHSMCPNDIDIVQNVEPEDSELGDIESLADVESDIEIVEKNIECTEETSLPCFKKEVESNSINEPPCILQVVDPDPISNTEIRDSDIYNCLSNKNNIELPENLSQTDDVSNPDSIPVCDNTLSYYEIPKISEYAQLPDPILHETVEVSVPVSLQSLNIEEIKVQESKGGECNVCHHINLPEDEVIQAAIQAALVSSEISKKNKGKKKKDLNKKGESKEGGEMDAFLDYKEEAPAMSVPAALSIPVEERAPTPSSLPVTIVDNEILSSIPLPGEALPDISPMSDASPDQPSEVSSVSPPAESEDKENMDESAQAKIVLKYSYKEDQWSPLNPEGKKQYDRDFLLQLQGQPMSLTKPINLPNLEVIKDKAHIQKLNEVNRNVQLPPAANYRDHFLPQYAQRGGGMPRIPQINFNNRRALPGQNSKTKKVISLSQNVKLHEAGNAWKPTHKLEVPEMPITELEKEKLRRSVQGILNKLTPQKFETLLLQLKNLNIDTAEKLNCVIDLIFEKAVDEPNFSVPYANMCKHLALIKVPTEKGESVNFRKLLLTKCQKEFEQDRNDELKHKERVKALAEAAPEKKKELEAEMYEEEKKMRYRQLGNIRFIGELFKLNMLIEPIMHECIKRLLTQGDEESLECLCKLLKTIGKELDEGKKQSKETMETYFTQMQTIVDKRLTSSRVRFMLQDIIDLKRNNWIPRRDENNPKTIDQIHKEAEREAREQQQVLQNITFNNKRIPDDRDRRKSTARNFITSEEGWTSSTKSNRGSYSIVDPNKLKLTKPDEVDSIRLGPGRAMQSWGRGSSGGTKAPAGSSDPDKTTLQNRYSALAEQTIPSGYIDNRRGSQRSAASSRESSRGRNSQLPPAIHKTPSTSKEREHVIEAVKGLVRSGAPVETKVEKQKITVEPQLNGKTAAAAELRLRGVDLPDEVMEEKTKPLIDEFLHNNDLDEAIRCVTEQASPNTIHVFISAAINQVLERSSQARHSLGHLLFSLIKKNIITFEQYKKGFVSVLEIIDEFALDIPLIWEYMGEIFEPMLEDSKRSLNFLKEVLEPCMPSVKAGRLVSETLHCAAKKRGTIKLGELWRESNLQWSDFLGENANVEEFIHNHKLEFTTCPIKTKPPSISMSPDEIRKHILQLLKKTDESEEIFDWIDANVSENQEPSFIRALVSAVHENAISDSGNGCELDPAKLKKRISLLTRYIDHNDVLELQALFAIQSLMNELDQPKGILSQIFDILYDEDVITEVAFKNWEQSDDINENEGKGVALHSVKSFFTWLKESDSPEETLE